MKRIFGLAILLAGGMASVQAAPVSFTMAFKPIFTTSDGQMIINDFLSSNHDTTGPNTPPFFSELTVAGILDFSLPVTGFNRDSPGSRMEFTYLPSSQSAFPVGLFAVSFLQNQPLPNGGVADRIDVRNNVAADGMSLFYFSVYFATGFNGSGEALQVVNWGSTPTVAQAFFIEGGEGTIYGIESGVSTAVSDESNSVPEPSAAVLAAAGFGLMLVRWKHRARA